MPRPPPRWRRSTDIVGNSVTFSVADSAEAIAGAAAGLSTMDHADRLSSIVADNDTVADVLTYGAGLASLGATATIHDSAAHVSANLDALEFLSGNGGVVTGITLSDSGTPDIGLTLLQITADANVLGLISSRSNMPSPTPRRSSLPIWALAAVRTS